MGPEVGDRELASVERAGMRAIWIRRDDADPPQAAVADRVIAHLDEIEVEASR